MIGYKEDLEKPKSQRRSLRDASSSGSGNQTFPKRFDRRDNGKPQKQQAPPNRAERRKAGQMSGEGAKANTAATSSSSSVPPAKKIKFDDSGAAAPVIAPIAAAPVASSRPVRSNFNAPVNKPAPTYRINHAALNTFAVDGKEWKESGVHPSWAAKQLSKPQIVQGQGKKITFD